jgi:hypothetical protein
VGTVSALHEVAGPGCVKWISHAGLEVSLDLVVDGGPGFGHLSIFGFQNCFRELVFGDGCNLLFKSKDLYPCEISLPRTVVASPLPAPSQQSSHRKRAAYIATIPRGTFIPIRMFLLSGMLTVWLCVKIGNGRGIHANI